MADPELANVRSDVATISEWVSHMLNDNKYPVQVFAMDNEPELWGVTHYDVHPTCSTYQEILSKYLEYATAVRKINRKVELAGPVTCCWYYYWDSAAGVSDRFLNGNKDFLPWFLQNVRSYDRKNNLKTLDVLDIHYYPDGIYNQNVVAETAAHRLRATTRRRAGTGRP